jgi:hypothetical protein
MLNLSQDQGPVLFLSFENVSFSGLILKILCFTRNHIKRHTVLCFRQVYDSSGFLNKDFIKLNNILTLLLHEPYTN